MFCTIEMKLDLFRLCLFLVTVVNIQVFAKIKFNTLQPPLRSRATTYVPRSFDKTCFLKPDIGPCRGNIPMYYFNPRHMNCSDFSWGGCQGNGNRFESESECLRTCVFPSNQPKFRPKFCQISFEYGYCFGSVERWYYDNKWKTCKTAIYSGCGGNRNNFNSSDQCEQVCRFGVKTDIKMTPKESNLQKFLIVNPKSATKKRIFTAATKPE